jgi:hypothetical protein
MRQVQEEVAGDIFTILIEQLRDQAFIIDTDQSEILGESCLGNSDILGKDFEIDFPISTPKNLIEDAKQEIQRLTNIMQLMNEEVENLGKKSLKKGKYSNVFSFSILYSLSFAHIYRALFINFTSDS